MNQHDDLIHSKTKRGGGFFIKNLLDVLHFQKMISAAKSSKLRAATLLRAIGNFARVGAIHLSGFFAEFYIRRFAISILNHPCRTSFQNAIQILKAARNRPLRTSSG